MLQKISLIITIPDDPQRASELQLLTDAQWREAIKSMANHAKYLGIYDDWRQLKHEYDLRSTRFDSVVWAAMFEEIY
ncbi:MAG TPA: hypothetical protein VJP79_12400 [Nitrososphaera sp.]|nr:hypothetical protein [Nitrososphaera sp.]